jgi:hypothetical protein
MSEFISMSDEWVDVEKVSYVSRIENVCDNKYIYINVVVDGHHLQIYYTDRKQAEEERNDLLDLLMPETA